MLDAQVVAEQAHAVPLLMATGLEIKCLKTQELLAKPQPVLASVIVRFGEIAVDWVEVRKHPAFGVLTVDQLKHCVPPGKVQATWSAMQPVE